MSLDRQSVYPRLIKTQPQTPNLKPHQTFKTATTPSTNKITSVVTIMMQSLVNSLRLSSKPKRRFHTSTVSAAKVVSRDTRIAGRLRFYKQVGVTDVSAPWKEEKDKAKNDNTIASPISAGVDGSDSASGVNHLRDLGSSQLEYMLQPRRPGSADPPGTPSEWFGVTLDGKTLKTPMGQTLAVPSQSLAFAIASEWDAQEKYLQPVSMPLMTLACTALDQVAQTPHVYRQQCLSFLPTDTVRKTGSKFYDSASFELSTHTLFLAQKDMFLGRPFHRSRATPSTGRSMERITRLCRRKIQPCSCVCHGSKRGDDYGSKA